MGYVIAAYAIALGAVGFYLLRLAREEKRLRAALAEERPAAPGDPEARSANPG